MTWKLRSLVAALMLLAVLLLPEGWISPADNGLYDHALRALPEEEAGPLLTVSMPAAQWTLEAIQPAIDYLLQQSVEQILVLEPPESLRPHARVLSGRTLWKQDEEWQRLGSKDAAADGGLYIPVSDDGVIRGVPYRLEVDSEPVDLLAARVADRDDHPVLGAIVRIDFRVPRDNLPRIEGQRLLEQALPASMLAGQSILLLRDKPAVVAVTTPRHRSAQALSENTFHASVFDAVLRQGIIHTPASAATLLAVSGWVIWMIVLAAVPRVSLWGLTFGLLLLVVLAVAGGLVFMQTWVFPTRVACLLLGLGLIEGLTRQRSDQQSLRRSLIALSAEVRERSAQQGILAVDSPWPLLDKVTRVLFDLPHSFLLQREAESDALIAPLPVGDGGVEDLLDTGPLTLAHPQLAEAVNRTPGTAVGQDPVILPIRSGNMLHGLWVFKLPETWAAAEAEASIERAVDLAGRLGQLIDFRERWQARKHTAESRGASRGNGWQRLPAQLGYSIKLLEESRDTLARALDRSREAVLVFDAFGHLVHQSGSSVELIAPTGLDLDQLEPATLLQAISAADAQTIRRTLGMVMLQREEATLMAREDLLEGRKFLLRIRAMGAAEDDEGVVHQALPGLLVLIQDITQLERAVVIKDEFVERLIFQLNNDFESIGLASDLLANPELTDDEREQLSGMLSEKVELSAKVLVDARSYLQESFSPVPQECYPVRFSPLAESALGAQQEEVDALRLQVVLNLPSYARLVLASPKPLEETLSAILHLLIEDAREESVLEITAHEHLEYLEIQMANNGFGFPQEMMDKHLASKDNDIEEFRQVALGLALVRQWGGELEARSTVGEGLVFNLKLRAMI